MQKFLVVMIIATILACVSTIQSVEARQDDVTEIIGLASKILEIAIHMDKPWGLSKRNHGIIDTLINIPDLDKLNPEVKFGLTNAEYQKWKIISSISGI